MSKLDNLTDFLTDVANAIREKKGTADKINPQDFSEEISSIKTEIESLPVNDVTFYDYDGIVLYSYTKEEFLALTEMPPLPTRKGLICQEWNWDYQDAIDYVAEYGILDVGATYITDDGKTRLYIEIIEGMPLETPLYFYQSISKNVNIDWGDGSAIEQVEGTAYVNTSHKYNSYGKYMITLEPLSSMTFRVGSGNASVNVFGDFTSVGFANAIKLTKVEMGNYVEFITAGTFKNCRNLSSIVLPSNRITYNPECMRGGYLKHITFPKTTTIDYSQPFSENVLKSVSVPNCNIKSDYFIANNHALKRIIFPPLTSIITPYVAQICYSLLYVIIPKTVTEVKRGAFYSCYSVKFYDFSHLEAIPTLENVNAFSGITSNCKIIVPDALYDEWIAATNWSTYASYIIRKTDWDSQK